MKRTLLLIGMLLASTSAQALYSGTDMLRMCGASVRHADGAKLSVEEMIEAVLCKGYVAGYMDAVPVVEFAVNAPRTMCLPETGISNEQGIRILVKYLREHPEDLHINARSILFKSMIMAFPCTK